MNLSYLFHLFLNCCKCLGVYFWTFTNIILKFNLAVYYSGYFLIIFYWWPHMFHLKLTQPFARKLVVASHHISKTGPGGRFKNTYELLNLRALKISKLHKNHIFQCMGKIFCVEFQRVPLKFHTKYLTHTLKDVDFIHIWKFKSSLI